MLFNRKSIPTTPTVTQVTITVAEIDEIFGSFAPSVVSRTPRAERDYQLISDERMRIVDERFGNLPKIPMTETQAGNYVNIDPRQLLELGLAPDAPMITGGMQSGLLVSLQLMDDGLWGTMFAPEYMTLAEYQRWADLGNAALAIQQSL